MQWHLHLQWAESLPSLHMKLGRRKMIIHWLLFSLHLRRSTNYWFWSIYPHRPYRSEKTLHPPQRIHHPPPTPRQSERAAHSPCNRWWWGGLGLGLIWGRCITASNCRLMYCNADAVRGGFTIEFLVFMVYMVYRRCLSFVESYTATSIQTAVVSQSSFWHFGVFMVYGWCGWFAPWCLFVYGVFIVTMVCAMEFMVCAMVLMVFIVYLRSI